MTLGQSVPPRKNSKCKFGFIGNKKFGMLEKEQSQYSWGRGTRWKGVFWIVEYLPFFMIFSCN